MIELHGGPWGGRTLKPGRHAPVVTSLRLPVWPEPDLVGPPYETAEYDFEQIDPNTGNMIYTYRETS